MSFKLQLSSFEEQRFHLKLLFSERRMSHSHVAIQKFAPMISACSAVFCNCLNCQLRQAFNKHKSISLVSKIYPAYTVYAAFACNVQRFLYMNGAAQQFCELTSLSQFYANLDKIVILFRKRGIKVNLENNVLTHLICFVEKHGKAFCMRLNRFLMHLNNRLCCTSILHFVCWKVS